MIDSIVFDLDGTLWDTCAACAVAWNGVLARRGIRFREITEHDVRRVTGQPHEDCIREVFVGVPEADVLTLIAETQVADNEMVAKLGGLLYPDVAQGLRRLAARYPLFIVSNCQAGYIETFFRWSGLAECFRDFECWGNTGLGKADNLAALIERNRLRHPALVGDTTGDQAAARECGVVFLHVDYGFGECADADRRFSSFGALVDWLVGEASAPRRLDSRGRRRDPTRARASAAPTRGERKEPTVSDQISIQFTRFSAFYSPLIATIAGGFLKAEGLDPKHSIAPAGTSAIAGVVDGTVHVCQSAPSQGFGPLEKGQAPPAVHFAQINEKDGFFLTARTPDPAFSWDKLRGKKVLVDHGGQPLAMFKYACHRRGLDFSAIDAVDVPSHQMDRAFRNGEGDYIHQQGPAPQQLEHDRVGRVVASVGEVIGPCAFSSLAATRDWLKTDSAKRFMRAYRKARAWLVATPAASVADAEAAFFPDIDRAVLTATIAAYQKLGCWTPHVEITPAAFEATLDVFQHAGLITRRHRYEDVVVPPPDAS